GQNLRPNLTLELMRELRGTPAEYAVHCPASLGALLLVRLEAPPTTSSAWFCSKVAVTTPEGGVSLFPCYRFVSSSTPLALRDSIGQFYTPLFSCSHLFKVLLPNSNLYCSYSWSCYDDGLPEMMKADDVMSLPTEVRFSVSKATGMMLTVGKVYVLPLSVLWKTLHLWRDDWFFGHQFLNGANPTLIRRCTGIPPNLVAEGYPPDLRPSEPDWLTAKTFVRSTDFADHELRSHFLRTHVMSELFAMATLRNFPTVHPLYRHQIKTRSTSLQL
uniref:Uncharacterized protein n=1 Tax=Anabas testudineus TaxID=64144 RepID=A0A7N6BMJ2_ANATE